MGQNNLSAIRQTALDNFNDIFQDGLKYVKHRTIAQFFVSLFKPRIHNIIVKEASEDELKNAMIRIKKRIDLTFKQLDIVEELEKARELNDPKTSQLVESILLKDNIFVPKLINEDRAAEILARLKLGPKM